MGCSRLCGAIQHPSQKQLLSAIREGDVDRDGRCHYCGSFASVAAECQTADSCDYSIRTSSGQVRHNSAKRTRSQRRNAASREAKYQTTHQHTANVHYSVSLRQHVGATPLVCKPVALAPTRIASQLCNTHKDLRYAEQRLRWLGKKEEARVRYQHQKRAENAYKKLFADVVAYVVRVGRKFSAREILHSIDAEPELTSEQLKLVSDSCVRAQQVSASMVEFLAHAKAWKQAECPHVAPKELLECKKEKRDARVPWDHLTYHLNSLRGCAVRDGTLGASQYDNCVHFALRAYERRSVVPTPILPAWYEEELQYIFVADKELLALEFLASQCNEFKTFEEDNYIENLLYLQDRVGFHLHCTEDCPYGITLTLVEPDDCWLEAPVVDCLYEMSEHLMVLDLMDMGQVPCEAPHRMFYLDEFGYEIVGHDFGGDECESEHFDDESDDGYDVEDLHYLHQQAEVDDHIAAMFEGKTDLETLAFGLQHEIITFADLGTTGEIVVRDGHTTILMDMPLSADEFFDCTDTIDTQSEGWEPPSEEDEIRENDMGWFAKTQKYFERTPYGVAPVPPRRTSGPLVWEREYHKYNMLYRNNKRTCIVHDRAINCYAPRPNCASYVRMRYIEVRDTWSDVSRLTYDDIMISLQKQVFVYHAIQNVADWGIPATREQMLVVDRRSLQPAAVMFREIEKNISFTSIGSLLAMDNINKSPPVYYRANTNIFSAEVQCATVTCNSAVGLDSEVQERMSEGGNYARPVSELVTQLKSRNAAVKGAGENRVADKKTLTEKEIFRSTTLVRKFCSGEKTHVAANLTSDQVVVAMAPKGQPTFTPLPRMTEEGMRKLLEMGVGSTSTVALDIGIQSHIPQGMPIVAFIVIMDTRIEDPKYASLCGSYLDLGRDRAKVLSLPLANFHLGTTAEEVEDALHGLVLATYFENPVKFSIGKAAFSYGTLEFQEHKPSAYSDFTRVRSSWDEIVRPCNMPRDRIVAGFSVLGSVSQDYQAPLPDFGPIDLKSPTNTKPPVITFDKPQRFDTLPDKRTFHMPATGFGNMTQRDVVNNWKSGDEPRTKWNYIPHESAHHSEQNAPRYALDNGLPVHTRSSTEALPVHTAPRFATCNSSAGVDTTIAAVEQFTCPADARAGRILAQIDIGSALFRHPSTFRADWFTKGLISPVMQLRLTVGCNPFVGVTIGVCFDPFGKFLVDSDTVVLPSYVSQALPNYVFPLSKSSEFVQELNIQEHMGHGIFPTFDSFGVARLIVYVVSDNAMPAVSDWLGMLELIVTRAESSDLAINPVVTLPYTANGTLALDLWRGPYTFEARGVREHRVHLNFGARTGNTRQQCISFPSALASFIQGHGGILHGEIVHIGTVGVSCTVHVCAPFRGAITDIRQAVLQPGARIVGGSGKFAVQVLSPYQRVSMLDEASTLTILLVAGPTATQNLNAPYEFMVHFTHMSTDNAVPRSIGGTAIFAWAQLHTFNGSGCFVARVPARLCDVQYPWCVTTMHVNPLADLVASCGFMSGVMTFTVMWSTEKNFVSTSTGTIRLSSHYGYSTGDPEAKVLQWKSARIGYASSLSIDVPVQNFSGFATSGYMMHAREHFIEIDVCERTSLISLDIQVQLHSGFAFYGRSIALVDVAIVQPTCPVDGGDHDMDLGRPGGMFEQLDRERRRQNATEL